MHPTLTPSPTTRLRASSQAAHARALEDAGAARAAAEAAAAEGEAALGRLRREQEAERERVKRALADLRKKLDRRARRGPCGSHGVSGLCMGWTPARRAGSAGEASCRPSLETGWACGRARWLASIGALSAQTTDTAQISGEPSRTQ